MTQNASAAVAVAPVDCSANQHADEIAHFILLHGWISAII